MHPYLIHNSLSEAAFLSSLLRVLRNCTIKIYVHIECTESKKINFLPLEEIKLHWQAF